MLSRSVLFFLPRPAFTVSAMPLFSFKYARHCPLGYFLRVGGHASFSIVLLRGSHVHPVVTLNRQRIRSLWNGFLKATDVRCHAAGVVGKRLYQDFVPHRY